MSEPRFEVLAPVEHLHGEASNVGELRRLLEGMAGDCPLRFDTKGPVEVVWRYDENGAVMILR